MINGVVRNFIARLNSDGSVDLSFDAGLGPDGSVRALAVQNDDKILVGGGFTSASGVPRNSVTRLNADGSLDNSFQPGAGANGPVFAIGLHANGKIVLGGDFTLFNGLTRNRIARLNEDGSMDTTINFGTGANDFVAAIAIQDDRKIVIGGGFTRFNGESRRYLARLQGGSLAGAGQVEFASANFEVRESEGSARITLRRTGGTSGAITVDYATQPGTAEPFINYRDVSGKLTFQPGETLRTFSVPILETALPGPEKTVQLVLSSPGGGGTLGRQPVGTLTIISDKSVIGFSQANFSVGEGGGNAVITLSRAGDVSVEAAVNYSTSPGTAQAGVDYVPVSGTLFFAPGQTNQSFAVPIIDDDLVEDNETVILNLSAPTGNAVLGLARATLTIIDDDFAPGVISFVPGPVSVSEGVGVVNLTVRRISGKTGVVTVNYATQDGSATAGLDYIPVSGMLTFAEGETSRTISVPIIDDTLVEGDEVFFVVLSDPTGGAVLGQPDVLMVTIIDNDVGAGSLDLSFDPGRGANGPVYAARVQPDGRIVVGGDFSTFNEVNRARVARLQLNGALDESFAPGAGPNQTVTALLPRPGGKVVIGGLFNTVNGILHNRVARLNANGTLDGGFNLPLGVNALVNALADQPDGKVLVGGMFDRASAVGRNRIARLNADGTLDVTFDPGSGANNAVQAVALQADGKVIIGGFFSSVNGVPRNGVARLHANGALDTAFAPGTGANGPVYAVLAQSDGRVLVAGEFTVFNGVSRNRIARLNANGTVDTAFNPGITGTGANNTIYALALQEGGKAVIGGNFTQFNGTGRNRIARLNANGSLDSSFDVGSGVNGPVYAVAGQADGSVILAGQFSEVDGVSRNGIARLIGDQTGLPSEARISFLLRQGNGQMQLLFNTQPGRVYVIEGSNDLVGWGTLGTVLATGTTGDFLDVAAPTQRHRFYRVRRNP